MAPIANGAEPSATRIDAGSHWDPQARHASPATTGPQTIAYMADR